MLLSIFPPPYISELQLRFKQQNNYIHVLFILVFFLQYYLSE